MSAPKDRVTIHVDPDGEGWAVQTRGYSWGDGMAVRGFTTVAKAVTAAESRQRHMLATGRHTPTIVLSAEAREATR